MKSRIVFAILFSFFFPVFLSHAEEVDCLKCHAKLANEKVQHLAVTMGCASCHTGIDASKTPHTRISSAFTKGLSADQPDLCYGCHGKDAFSKKNVHAAVGMGCTGCHDPHSSKNAKLLKSEAPDLCLTCHDKAGFNHKTVHAPVMGGMCLSCHTPHSSDQIALLLKRPYDLCLDCHAEVPKKPHAVSGFSKSRHPLGEQKKERKRENKKWVEVLIDPPADPARPDKPFYCGSCHSPHSTDTPKLLKFKAKSAMSLCGNCHKY